MSGSVQTSSSVQGVPSARGTPTHTPVLQRSFAVHWFSSVHGVPSTTMVPVQAPLKQTSPTVHELRSVHRAPSATPLKLATTAGTGVGSGDEAPARATNPGAPHRTALTASVSGIQDGSRNDDGISGTARPQHLRSGAIREIHAPPGHRNRVRLAIGDHILGVTPRPKNGCSQPAASKIGPWFQGVPGGHPQPFHPLSTPHTRIWCVIMSDYTTRNKKQKKKDKPTTPRQTQQNKKRVEQRRCGEGLPMLEK